MTAAPKPISVRDTSVPLRIRVRTLSTLSSNLAKSEVLSKSVSRSESAPGNKQHARAILRLIQLGSQLLSGYVDRALSDEKLSAGNL